MWDTKTHFFFWCGPQKQNNANRRTSRTEEEVQPISGSCKFPFSICHQTNHLTLVKLSLTLVVSCSGACFRGILMLSRPYSFPNAIWLRLYLMPFEMFRLGWPPESRQFESSVRDPSFDWDSFKSSSGFVVCLVVCFGHSLVYSVIKLQCGGSSLALQYR